MAEVARGTGVAVERLETAAYTVPTEEPESDGTLEWDATTIVVVEATAAGHTGLGYTYGSPAAAGVVRHELAPHVEGADVMSVRRIWESMVRAVRNVGRQGVAATAVSAVDIALWDLEARVLDVPLVTLLGAGCARVPVYGSGGFTSYPPARLEKQLCGWVEQGIPRVKMKVGREPAADRARALSARKAVGDDVELMVDANGAYALKQALAFARDYAELGVTWFEEPVSSDDLDGLRFLRERAPSPIEIAAGEYAWDPWCSAAMLDAGAVDVLQADVTRDLGITGFLETAALCHARRVPLSAHTAPQASVHVAAAAPTLRHLEWFHDHVRVERLLFDGVLDPVDGALVPDRSRPGTGLELRRADAERFRTRA